jgi:two-component system, NtrC family, response regulator AtoC
VSSLRILVIDDEAAARQVLADVLSKAGYAVDTAADAASATARLARDDVDVALCDMQLPDGNGLDLLKQSRAASQETTFLMVTAFASVETAVEALRAGAYDYIIKPVRHSEVLHRLQQIEAINKLRDENRALKKAVRDRKPLYRCNSAAMRRIERLVAKVAPTDSTVLITGESGTGKSVVARSIHESSRRCEGPLLAVNCGAIPDQLLESEFFGHTKGAYTGADRPTKGLFLESDGGTLFLDEIGELPMPMQTKLLHVIEEKEVRPLGGGPARQVDTRIIAATNRNLAQMVADRRFREDLYFRLGVFEIAIPPLRERPDDLRGLIQFMLLRHRPHSGNSQVLKLEPDADEALNAYTWPGNVRELDNVISRACILAEANTITVDDLPVELMESVSRNGRAPAANGSGSLAELRREFEVGVIRRAIEKAGGDRRLAAQRLKISLSSLYAKLSHLPADTPWSGEAELEGTDRRPED